MKNLMSFLAEADEAALRLERARRELEAAKQNLDSAKQNYDFVIAQSDEIGVPRAKLKRLTEERLAALIDTGLANLPANPGAAARPIEVKSPGSVAPSKGRGRPKKNKDAEVGNERNDDFLSDASEDGERFLEEGH